MRKFLSSLILFCLFSSFIIIPPAEVSAAATPSCTVTGNFDPFIGENTTINVNFTNTGADVGYAPFTELVLPADTTFSSASYLGLSVSPVGGAVVVTDNDGGDPLTGEVTNPITGATSLLDVGSTYVPLRYPLGSYTPTQGTATLNVNVGINSGVTADTPLTPNFQARCGFELGEDPLDNPGGDPPIVSGFVGNPITPRIIQNTKSYTTTSAEQDGETVTGPNFPLTYTVNVDIADGETVTGITVNDTLAPELVLTEITSINDGGNGFTITYTPTVGAPQVSSTVPFSITSPSAGGSLSVALTSLTGTTSASDGRIVYDAYIAELDSTSTAILDPNTPNPTNTVTNTVTTQGTYNAQSINSGATNANVTAKGVAVQKSSSIVNNVGTGSYSPGDTVRYTVSFQISDYFAFDTVAVEDILPDGLVYVDSSASLSVTEDGATQTPAFTETDVTEAVFTGGTPYNFAGDCAGCSLAIMEDTTNDDDAVTSPGDGQTRLLFDISSILPDGELEGGLRNGTPVGQPTTATLTYDAIIQESFIDGVAQDQSIDATDPFVNNAEVSFDLTSGTGGFGTDDASTTFTIVPPIHSKSMSAVVDSVSGFVDAVPFTNTPPRVNPGGGVVFSLQVDIPSGDLEDLIITDFLPSPFFDATTISTTFDAGSTTTPYTPSEGVPGSVPTAGTVAYGSGTTGLSTPYPTPTLTTNASDNTLRIDFDNQSTFESNPSDPASLEILFHVTTTNAAFASGLSLVNMASFDGANSSGGISIGTGIVNMVSGGPNVITRKGTVDSSKGTAVYTPATVGPTSFDGTANPVFTGVITTEDLATSSVGSSIDEVDAEDRITFAVILENDGTIPAFDIALTDTLPTGFRSPTSVADLNLRIYDGGGTDLGAQTTGGLFGQNVQGGATDGTDTTISFLPAYSLPPHDTTGSYQTGKGLANQGDNILVITYDLYPDVTVNIEAEPENTATLTQYAGTTGGNNYALNPVKNQASVTVGFSEPTFTKTAAVHPTLDAPDTTFPDVSIGEATRYTLQVTVPEGTTSNAEVVDNIPNGLAYYMTNGVTVDTSASCTGTAFAGTVPSLTVTPNGAGLAGNGADITIDFDANIVATADNNTANNTFCLLYDAVVTDVPAVVDNTTLSNQATFTYGTAGSIGPVSTNVNARVGTLRAAKGVTPTTGDAGDTFTYTITVDQAPGSTYPMFDIVVTDQVPATMSVSTNFSSDGLDNDGDGLTDGADADEVDGAAAPFFNGTDTFTFNSTNNPNNGGTNAFDKVSSGDSIIMRFAATANNTVSPTEVITNQANLQYDSYQGTSPADIPERVVNTNNSANITINDISVGKAFHNSDNLLTGTSQYNGTIQDIAIGEQVTYRITVDIPEGNLTNFTIQDDMPDRIRIDSATLIQDDTGSAAPTILLSDENTDTFNDRALFTFASISNPADADTETIVVEVIGTLLNNPSNATSQTKTNTATIDYTEKAGPPSTSTVNIEVVEPNLNITKSLDVNSGQGNQAVEYTINVAHQNSFAPAYGIEITDTIPAGITLNTNFSSDGVDNDGDGLTDGADADEVDGAAAPFFNGTDTFTFNSTNNPNNGGTNLYDTLPLGSSFDIKFTGTIQSNVFPGQTIVNRADATYNSGAAGPQTRSYSGFDTTTFTVSQITASKSVTATSFTQTGSTKFNAGLDDIAVGETITYTIPIGVPISDFTNLVVQDTLPAGFTVTQATLQSVDAGISLTPAVPNINFANNTATYNLGNISATSAGNITLSLQAVVTSSVAAGTGYTNNVSANFTENTGAAITATADVDVVKPAITLDKTGDVMNGDAGDSFVFTLNLNNTGSGPAFDLSMTDVVPSVFTIASPGTDGLDNDGDGSTDEADEVTASFLAGNNFTWNATTAGSQFDFLDSGNSLSLQYRVTMGVAATPGGTLTNDVNLNYDSALGANANQESFLGTNDADVSINLGTIAKTLDTPGTDKGIGETIPYLITVTVPEGTTNGLVVTDTLPAGLALVPGTVALTPSSGDISIANNPPTITDTPTSVAIVAGQTQSLTFNLGQVINSNTDNGTAETIEVRYQAVLLNTNDNTAGGTHTNQASVDFGGLGSDGPVSSPAVRVVEPIMSLQKSTSYTQGDTATYTLRVENNALSATGVAHDVVITDVIPAGMTYTGGEVFTNVPVAPTIDTSGLPTIRYTFPTVPATFNSANPLLFSYNVAIPLSTAEGTVLTNNANLVATSAAGTPADVIPGNTNSGERSYNQNTNAPLTVTRPNLSTSDKSVVDLNGGDPESGDILEYTLDIINTGNAAATGIQVIDHIPPFVTNFTITTPPASGVNNSQSAPAGNNNTGLLQFDTITLDAAGGANDSVQIVYQVTVAPGTPDNTNIQNSMTVSPATEGGSGASDTETLGLDFPILQLEKTVDFPTIVGGSSELTYTIDITNAGTGESTNTTLVDTLPPELIYIENSLTKDGNPITDTNDGDEGDFGITNAGAVTFVLPTLASGGGTSQIKFKVRTLKVSSSQLVTNTVTATDNQGSSQNDSTNLTINPVSGGSAPSAAGPNQKIVYGCYCNAFEVPSCTRMIVNEGNTYQSCSANSDCSCNGTNPVENINIPTPEPENETLSEELEEEQEQEEEPIEEKPKELACEEDPLKRIPDNFLYTDRIPFTGNIPQWLRDHYGAFSILPSVDQGHPYYQAALDLSYQGIIDDYRQGGNARMQDMLSRAEMAKIAARSGQINITRGSGCISNPFEDVIAGAWYEDYVLNLAKRDIIHGYEDGLYYPLNDVRLGEFAKTFVNTFQLKANIRSANPWEHWSQPFYDVLIEKDIIPGELRGRSLDSAVARAEAFEMVRRIVRMVDSNESKYLHTITMSVPKLDLFDLNVQNTLISDENVWLDALTNTGVGYYYDHVNDNTIVFGHSSIWDGDPTPYGAVFERAIDEALIGDTFTLIVDGTERTYKIKTRDRVLWENYPFLQESAPDIDAVWFTCDRDLDYRWVFKAEEVTPQ